MNARHNEDIRWFLTATPEECLEAFAKLPKAVRGDGFVYVPGERAWAERVLLVGHADTVRRTQLTPRNLMCHSNVFMTADREPLGADDRAGLAMLWTLNSSEIQHSFLITDGEEVGGIGARNAAASLLGELIQHAFFVEVDRQGREEMVFYDETTNAAFREWLAQHFANWSVGWGSYTDIATLSPEALRCGVNLAAGFRKQHTAGETLTYADWLTTLKALRPVLGMEEYPEFGDPTEEEPRVMCYPIHGGGKDYWDNYASRWNAKDDEEWRKRWGAEDDVDAPAADVVKIDDVTWIAVMNDAGDIVDYIELERLNGDLAYEAMTEGCVYECDLDEMEDDAEDEAVVVEVIAASA